jgi:glycine/D-amino acid oxidase-like deaminating enzyme
MGGEASGANAGSMALQNKELETIRLSEESLQLWAQLQEELGRDLEFRQPGGLRVAEDPDQLNQLLLDIKQQRKLGLDISLLSSEELRSFAPYLGARVVAASFCSKDARANPLAALTVLSGAARAIGAKIYPEEPVVEIQVEARDRFSVRTTKRTYIASCVLNCAGVWSKQIFRMVGLDVPITPAPQQMIVTEAAPPLFSPIISHVGGRLTLKQVENGNVLIGGGWPAIGDVQRVIKQLKQESLLGNIQLALRVIPALKGLNILRFWAGLEGRSPDFLPLLGNPKTLPGFYCACCAKGGFTMGPILGKLLSELVLNGKASFPIGEFDVNRVLIG